MGNGERFNQIKCVSVLAELTMPYERTCVVSINLPLELQKGYRTSHGIWIHIHAFNHARFHWCNNISD